MADPGDDERLLLLLLRFILIRRRRLQQNQGRTRLWVKRKSQDEFGSERTSCVRELYFRNVVMLAFFAVVFEVPAGLVKN